MGGGGSRSRQSQVPFPQLNARSSSSFPPYSTGSSPLSRRQQKQLEEANKTIQNLQTKMMAMQQRTGPPPIISPYPTPPSPPLPPPPSVYRPPSPLLQQLAAQANSPYAAGPYAMGFRETDYAAVANISGLNPTDVALLHREYVNLTRGGTNKIDRVVFRQLLRESMIEANNENIDRAIENIFVHIDRNRDGFIDFPEFIGAFRDLIRGNSLDPLNSLAQNFLPPATTAPPTAQTPMVYNGPNPLVISLDQNSSPYMINSPIQTPSALQCVPLPMI